QDLETEAGAPALEERPRQGLSRGDTEPDRREVIRGALFRGREKRRIRGRHAVEDGRPFGSDRREDRARLWAPGEQDRRRAVPKRDNERVVQAVREEELRDAEHAVVGR